MAHVFDGVNDTINVEVVTAAGSVQADAAAIPIKSSIALVTASGDNTVGVRLPPASRGKVFFIKNTGAGTLRVYPAGTDAINAIIAGSPIVMGALTSATFIAQTSAQWFTVPLLPS